MKSCKIYCRTLSQFPKGIRHEENSKYRRFPQPPDMWSLDERNDALYRLWQNWGYCRYYHYDGEYGYLQCFPNRPGSSGQIYHISPSTREYIAREEELLDMLNRFRSHKTEAIEKQAETVKKAQALYPETRKQMEDTIDHLNEQVAKFLTDRDVQPWALEDDRLLGPGPWPRGCRGYPLTREPVERQLMPSGQVCFPEAYGPEHLLFPFEVDGKWGYCNIKRSVFSPQWSFCDHFQSIPRIARFNLYDGYDPAISDFYSDEETNHNHPGYQGRWGFLREDGSLLDIPVYQYISQAVRGWRLVKKCGFWGLATDEGDILEGELFWDDMWFWLGDGCIAVAKKNTKHGPRYTFFTEDTGEILVSGLEHPDQLYEEDDSDE